ncbi:PREDICTED: uncharacterized protein LOC104819870 [Tarenaya hassleriana]|uniref:uncharacterized protein LOC104819870 n=1 Tax=Tarenaya hassleriana TaxID=28532 RepID=UPI00053C4254|nr:PREDICTED: uncharacterized protein LOC104819870 [Tarenaya hassleriana]
MKKRPEKMEAAAAAAAAAADGRKEMPAAEGEEVKIADVSFKSPYLDYDTLDEYKMKGYGAKGHVEPKPGRGAGATDAPTPSGAYAAVSSDASGGSVINRQGVP